ncbi:MAG: uncharacterized protein QOI20_720, partial [Acidimicrobiaceae bacterium]|nr:uncharacterized protein [Acidimicrobiaceae bacterium]
LRDGEVLAALEVADSFKGRLRGLLGRDGLDGALLIESTKAVHTVGMRFPIDVAFCDADMVVLTTLCLRRHRLCLPRLKAHCAIEAEAGAFERWRLRPGDTLEVKG